jgi:hypothetical protein
MDILDRGFLLQRMSRKGSSRAHTQKFTIKDTPKCTMFSIPWITGQAWTRQLKLSARLIAQDAAPQKELLLPLQRYGIDFHGVHNGEILS